jgi:D-alanine-D-alanine ligase
VNERGGIDLHETAVDVVFPLLHGTFGEDGAIQGVLEMAGIPYVGSGVLGSAVSMDKMMMKSLFAQAGLPSVPHRLVLASEWGRRGREVVEELELQLEYPLFVKPCNLGSSVGISKAHGRSELESAIDLATRYDRRVIVEGGVDAREFECSVLGNDEPMVSVVGEIVPRNEWYDYDSKYTEGLADLIIPARLEPDLAETVRSYARRAFEAVDAAGLARVDFFVRRDNHQIIVNEINTIPGFTSTSMYPKLWEASGVSYPELIDRLIQFALERHGRTAHRWVHRT